MNIVIPEGHFRGYIFDLDGTLADTMPLHYRAWRRMLQEYGMVFSEEQFYELGGKPTLEILRVLSTTRGLEVSEIREAAERKEEYFVELLAEVKPIEEILEIVRGAHGSIPMAVATGGMRKYAEMTLDALNIRPLFAALVCLEDYYRPKPFPDAFLEAARRLGVEPSRCLAFEDSLQGIRAATAAGMQCVVVPRS
jgi:beta-phosphoglucomutase family hydrolase